MSGYGRYGGFADGLTQGYALGSKMVADLREGKLRDQIAQIAGEKPEESTGFTEDQGAQLRAISEAKDANGNPYYKVGVDDTGKYQVTPNFGDAPKPVDFAAKQGVSFLGTQYDHKLTPDEMQSARQDAMASAREQSGDFEGAQRMRQLAQQTKLTGLQIGQAERADAAGKRDEEYQAGLQELFHNMSGAKLQMTNQDAITKYRSDLQQYKGAREANPNAAIPEPVRPVLQAVTPADRLADASALIEYNMAHGKVQPAEFMQLSKMRDEYAKESNVDAYRKLQAGDAKGAAVAFGLPKDAKFEVRQTVADVNGVKIPTYEMVVKESDGGVTVHNGFKGLQALDSADKVISQAVQGEQLKLSKQQVAISGGHLALSQKQAAAADAERARVIGDARSKAEAAVGLYAEQHPQATTAELEAVRRGVMEAIPSTSTNNFEQSVTKDGDTNMPVISRMNRKDGSIDIINPGTGSQKRIAVNPPAASAPTFATEADAEIAARAGKIKSGQAIVVGGKTGTWR